MGNNLASQRISLIMKVLRLHQNFIISFGSLVKNCNHKRLGIYYLLSAFIFEILLSDIKDCPIIPLGSLHNSSNAFINITNLNRRSYTLSTLILVFWTSRSLHLNNSSIWDH